MSLKAAQFTSIVTNPANVYRFEIVIPGIDYTVIAESTTYPSQGETRKISLWYQGEEITYPGLPKNGGEWSFKIPDSSSMEIKKQFDKLAAKFYNQRTGKLTPIPWKDIKIYSYDIDDSISFSCVLHGAWLFKRDDISLDASKAEEALKWNYTFHYTWFEDGPNPRETGYTNPINDVNGQMEP